MINDDIIQDFLEVEITEDTFQIIYDFITLHNFRFGEYEGNQYVIRKMNRKYIQIEDEVATENTRKPEVHVYPIGKLQSLLDSYKSQWIE